MKKQILFIILLMVGKFCTAQNLVPNGNFDVISGCPASQNQVYLAAPWGVPSNTDSASPDLYNACDNGSQGVPSNVAGYQNALSGNGYAGFYTYGFNCREYVQVQLTSPLIAGVTYKAEMYVSPSDAAGIAVDAIGMYISTGPISGNGTYEPLPVVPQISNPANSIISDTLNWTLVTGFYMASGGEDYITLGSFVHDSSTATSVIISGGWGRGYYLVDNVSVSIATGISETGENESITVFPNPFHEKLTFSVESNELTEFNLFDVMGRKVAGHTFTNSATLNTNQLAKGIYFYEVKSSDGMIQNGKLVRD